MHENNRVGHCSPAMNYFPPDLRWQHSPKDNCLFITHPSFRPKWGTTCPSQTHEDSGLCFRNLWVTSCQSHPNFCCGVPSINTAGNTAVAARVGKLGESGQSQRKDNPVKGGATLALTKRKHGWHIQHISTGIWINGSRISRNVSELSKLTGTFLESTFFQTWERYYLLTTIPSTRFHSSIFKQDLFSSSLLPSSLPCLLPFTHSGLLSVSLSRVLLPSLSSSTLLFALLVVLSGSIATLTPTCTHMHVNTERQGRHEGTCVCASLFQLAWQTVFQIHPFPWKFRFSW